MHETCPFGFAAHISIFIPMRISMQRHGIGAGCAASAAEAFPRQSAASCATART
jgi:hypothetical protein